MDKYGTVLVSEEEIQKRVAELGKQITEDYSDKKLLMVGILKGSVFFLADLARAVDKLVQIDFMVVSSYGNSTSTSGIVRIVKDLEKSIEDVDVLIVEDIVDSGLTLSYLKDVLQGRNPKSVKICTLLDKKIKRKIDIQPDYVGFSIPNDFVVGYGLDYAEKYRNLKDILIISPELI